MKTDMEKEAWPTAEQKQKCVAQAKALRKQAAEGGLRFEAYLPPQLAEWLLERIEKGVFLDPSEAVFVLLGEYEELEPHTDLRQELAAPRPEPAAWMPPSARAVPNGLVHSADQGLE
jgi:antitoxin ParD1/3/4